MDLSLWRPPVGRGDFLMPMVRSDGAKGWKNSTRPFTFFRFAFFCRVVRRRSPEAPSRCPLAIGGRDRACAPLAVLATIFAVRSRVAFSLGCALSVLLFAPALRAERAVSERLGPVRLVYERKAGAETCPDESAFRDAVVTRARSGTEPFEEGAHARLVVALRLVVGQGYVAHTELVDADTTWSSDVGPLWDCRLLVSAAALDVASLFSRPLPRPMQPIAPAEPVMDRPKPPPKQAPSRPGVRLGLTAGAAFGVGASVAAPLLAVDVGLRWAPFSLSVQGRAGLPIGGDVQNARITASRYTGALVPCGHVWYFVGCVVAELGAVRVAVASARPDASTLFWAGLGARAGLEFPLGESPVALRFSGDALIALRRAEVILDSTSRWVAPPVSGSLEGGALITF